MFVKYDLKKLTYTFYVLYVQSPLAYLRTLCPQKVRKYMRDRKDTRCTKYTYYKGCFSILLLVKSRQGVFPLLTTCLLYL